MVGSAKPAVAMSALALIAFAGCDSTQSKNARAELRAKRELASRELPGVVRSDPRLRVERVALVRGEQRGSAAIVVDLRSRASKPLTDVPIAVGVRGRDGRTRLVNAKRHLNWFQTHVPAIPARGSATWVFKGARGIEAGDRAFAKVGRPARPALSSAAALPRIEAFAEAPVAAPVKASKKGKGPARAPTARVVVENPSGVPQYDLQVYALAQRDGRYVAAGKAEVKHLGTGQRATVAIPLAGSARTRPLRVAAIPTIFD